MNEIIDFFLEPYRTASTLHILLEFLAASFGVASVIYAKKENIWVFPTGIISTGIYVYLLYQWSLYGDLIINIYYTLMSVFGWYMWSRVVDNDAGSISISRTNTLDKIKAVGIFLFTSVFVIIVYRYYDVMPNSLNFNESVNYAFTKLTSGNIEDFKIATPFIDTFTTGIFFAAMWLMALKKIENWSLWIIGNAASIPLYFIRGYGFTGIQYIIFLILAILAYKQWKKNLNKKQVPA
ncbi:nicotinamide riboside transporter PnuC [Oceanihabitans sediminis]|uniref:Nicotinamide riboside transporter PnuC n=1 Tax=Oceanihabitans sediminis TaxID=1812012 RepID=A0A368P9G5_9FLAO|nr:nicotinamide riboside transporter PnuC [Oceanihabitans sediminis]MDX1277593.1 nicotinamide riboside transporter PnuC [Oceanihabitans sediminis]MDX1773232.1 nicotinamide riboside transporter PnuC [Oceanihabitans sediminis]RBP34925.1 nicotinamide mononucleotide transporter [Oceanihabitans sediminis]RCU58565.1 nicotinamide riboside transporter PnuC [Oceanihabitans sediminis]